MRALTHTAPAAKLRLARALALFATTLAVAPARHVAAQAAEPALERLVLVDVTVVDPPHGSTRAARRLEHQTLVVAGDRIEALGPNGSLDVPPAARVVRAPGLFVVPGFTDMHGHLPTPDDGPGGFELDAVLGLFVANGVTTVRSMLGHATHLVLRDEIARGERLGPRLVVGSPALYGTPDLTAEKASEDVATYAEEGYDFVKVHENLTPDVYAAVAAACRARELPFAGHVTDLISLETAFAAGQATIDHLDNFLLQTLAVSRAPSSSEADTDGWPSEPPPPVASPHLFVPRVDLARLPTLAARARGAGVAVVPTLELWETFASERSGAELWAERSERDYVPAALAAYWTRSADNRLEYYTADDLGARWLAQRRAVLAALEAAGVSLLCGTDSPQEFNVPGFSLAREMQRLAAYGLSPARVLETATTAPASFFGRSAIEGRVAVGRRADLVLLRADPLLDVVHVGTVEGVVLAGRYLDRGALDQLLAAARSAAGTEIQLPGPPAQER